MISSIFNFRKPRSKRYIVYFLIGALAFLCAVLVGDRLSQKTHLSAYRHLNSEAQGLFRNDWYIDYGLGVNAISHHLFYYDITPSLHYAQQADILFLGNSRTLVAFPLEVLQPFLRSKQIHAYNMGFGHQETYIFPQQIIKKYNLRPKLVIINADGFFGNKPSEHARTIMHTSWWPDFTGKIESYRDYLYFQHFRQVLPHFLPDPRINVKAKKSAVFRSVQYGTWYPWHWKKTGSEVKQNQTADGLSQSHIQYALEFKTLMQTRGAEIIITYIPNNDPYLSYAEARELANILKVSFVSPIIPHLQTIDESHLDYHSSVKFAQKFLTTLERTPEFQSIHNRP